MAVVNPRRILWVDPTAFTDGTPFGASDFRAYELGKVEGGETVPLLVLPTAFGVGESPIPDAVKAVTGVVQQLRLRTLDNYDQVSEWSSPPVEARFTTPPLAPSGLEVVL